METGDIFCAACGKFILTEARQYVGGDIKCIAGSYEDGYYSGAEDLFYCIECAKEKGYLDTE